MRYTVYVVCTSYTSCARTSTLTFSKIVALAEGVATLNRPHAALPVASIVHAIRAIAVCAAVTIATVCRAQDQMAIDIQEAVIRVPTAAKDAFGKESRGELIVTTFRPAGAGPFPLVIINHGRDSATRTQMPRQRYESAARYFIRKGFAVAVPQRLGYGELAAAGDPEQGLECPNPRYVPAAQAAAGEIADVVRHLQSQPDVDARRIVLVGQSVGGFAVVAVASMQPAGLVTAVNFAGGGGGNPRTHPGEPCSAYQIEQAMRQFGSTSKAPTLWVYAENDQYFGPRHSRAWFNAFVKAGGQAEYRLMPAFGEDGHRLFVQGNDHWQPVMDEFLARHGFTQPGVLQAPAPSGFARLDDIDAPPLSTAAARDDYRKYLAANAPKAFAIGPGGRYGFASGDDALSRALGFCQRRTGISCKLYAVNDQVVWQP